MQVHEFGRKRLVMLGLCVQVAQYLLGSQCRCTWATDLKLMATIADFNLQSLLDLFQVLVELATKISQSVRAVRFEC